MEHFYCIYKFQHTYEMTRKLLLVNFKFLIRSRFQQLDFLFSKNFQKLNSVLFFDSKISNSAIWTYKSTWRNMKSSKSSSSPASPQHVFSREFCLDPHAEFELDLNRSLGELESANEDHEQHTFRMSVRSLHGILLSFFIIFHVDGTP